MSKMAANESIADPLVFLIMSCFSLFKGRECYDLNIQKRDIYI